MNNHHAEDYFDHVAALKKHHGLNQDGSPIKARMTQSQMFLEAHKQAKIDQRKFGGDCRHRFGNALRGFYAARNGYDGGFVR